MANKNISGLTAATTPLAGTELVPVWNGTATQKVSVDNLTTGKPVAATQFTASTGNFVPATSGKGINFTANNPAAGMTSQLLNWYEEGTWTPTDGSGAGLILTSASGTYTRKGREVTCFAWCGYPVNANASALTIAGLPFAAASTTTMMGVSCYNSAGFQLFGRAGSTTSLIFVKNDNTDVLNSFESGKLFGIHFTYFI